MFGSLALSVVVALLLAGPAAAAYHSGYRPRVGALALPRREWLAFAMPAIGIAMGLLAANTFFPELSHNYVAWGGPTWWLLIAAVVSGIVAAIYPAYKQWVMIPVGLVLAIAIFRSLGLALFWDAPCYADDTACIERVAEKEAEELAEDIARAERRAAIAMAEERAESKSDECPGLMNGGRPLTLAAGAGWVKVNDGTCRVMHDIVDGCVDFDTSAGLKTFGPEDGIIKGYTYAVRAASCSRTAKVILSLCPLNTVGHRLNLDCTRLRS